jgi:hypothetical protein
MRTRAAALTLALIALLPAAASAQQLAVASSDAVVQPSAAAAAPISKRDRVSLESRLQHVALLQELYWTEHKTYTTDIAALEPSALTAPRGLEIVSATADGWSARAELPSRPGIGCVMSVGTADRSTTGTVVAAGGTAPGKRVRDAKQPAHPADRPAIVCDR